MNQQNINLLVAALASIIFATVMLISRCNQEVTPLQNVAPVTETATPVEKPFSPNLSRSMDIAYSLSESGAEKAIEMVDGFYTIQGQEVTFKIDDYVVADQMEWQQIPNYNNDRILFLGLPIHELSPISKMVLDGDMLYIEFTSGDTITLLSEEDYYVHFRSSKPI